MPSRTLLLFLPVKMVVIGFKLWHFCRNSVCSQSKAEWHTTQLPAHVRRPDNPKSWSAPKVPLYFVVFKPLKRDHTVVLFDFQVATVISRGHGLRVLCILSFCSFLEANQWTWALTILSAMSSNFVEADVVTYNACVAACEKGSQWQQVLSLMGEMQMASVLANLITYNAAITACANVLVWFHALCLLQLANTEQLQANVISYSEAVRACRVVTSYAPNLFDLLGGKSQADLSDLCRC